MVSADSCTAIELEAEQMIFKVSAVHSNAAVDEACQMWNDHDEAGVRFSACGAKLLADFVWRKNLFQGEITHVCLRV